jgi:hypothetical protein
MDHEWIFLPASRQAGPDELISGVLAVCRNCGMLRAASTEEAKIDLAGECEGSGEPVAWTAA